MPSVVSRLESSLHSIVDRTADLIRDIPVKHINRSRGGVVFIAPKYYWGPTSPEQISTQLEIKRNYDVWLEILRSVLRNAPKKLTVKIKKADQALCRWIELDRNWSMSTDRTENERLLRKDAERFVDIIAILETIGSIETILVPDTNAIVGEPDPTRYKAISEEESFVFLLLPTVLAELDEMKNAHRNPDFREKVKRTITRIKGWRNQGSLLDGVTVSRTITVRAIASEPDMQSTLTWLDKDNRDDRIIASVLEVQSDSPSARVVLVTGDINLLNKADVAQIEHVDRDTI